MRIICKFLGHDWRAKGWSSKAVDQLIPKGVVRNLWYCCRCKKNAYVDELPSEIKQRFDGYKEKYGQAIVSTHEFSPPKPS